MPESYRYAALLLFLFAHLSAHAYDSITPAASNTSSASLPSALSTSTCPARTINYITHSLPQQCLTTSWSGGKTTITGGGAGNETILLSTSTLGTQRDASVQNTATHSTHSAEATASDAAALPVQLDHVPSTQVIPSEYTDPLPIVVVEPELDNDSPLDNINFLSFEDWKKQNLAKAGQSAENVGNRRLESQGEEARRRPGNIKNALDSLGEDSEIELDFGGFVSSSGGEESTKPPGAEAVSKGPYSENGDGKQGNTFEGATSRSKDAGKTCKERFNYASFDCAATVLKTNRQCKGSSSVLVENKDSYMLNECSADNKFFIVELCGDILVDTIVLANFEFFSSMFRTFRVSVSDRYPVRLDKWKELGTFEARNSREVQPFLVEHPLIWARYLRIEFLTHYGNEFYCPVSLLRVHGTTMMEEFRHQEEAARGEEEEYQEDPVATQLKVDETVPARIIGYDIPEAEQQHEMNATVSVQDPKISPAAATPSSASSTSLMDQDDLQPLSDQEDNGSTEGVPECEEEYSLSTAVIMPFNATDFVCYQIEVESIQASEEHGEPADTNPTSLDVVSSVPGSQQETSVRQGPSVPASAGASASSVSNHVTSTVSSTTSIPVAETKALPSSPNSTVSTRTSDQNANEQRKTSSSATAPAHSNPVTQENFFKSIHKRLQFLETNSTLSLQYIEEQSRILREAFTKVEKRQLSKTTTFLEHLNSTVLAELRGFRQQYDQIWQSTVIELETQREQSHREVIAISARLSVLADEVIFQKRMSIVQSVLILLCLGLIIFSRGAASSYLELPLVQSMVNKSQRRLRHSFESPSESPPSTRPTSSRREGNRFGHFDGHSRNHSEDSVLSGARSLIIEYSPPTPISDPGQSDASSAGRRSPSPTPSESQEKRMVAEEPANSSSPPRRPARTKKHSLSWPESAFVDSGLLRPDSMLERSREAAHD
jgi:hypothetical protein